MRGVRVRSVPAARPWGPAPPHIFTQLQPGNKLSGVRTALSARGEEALRPHKSALSARTMTDAPDYRDTVFLPKTDFPMKAGLPQKEPAILAKWLDRKSTRLNSSH